MPNEYDSYLCVVCCGKDGRIDKRIDVVMYGIGIIGKWMCDEKEFVTHWMELPELPKIEF